MKEPKFRIGSIVYHITPESEAAAVIDIFYSYAKESFSYIVALGFGEERVCREYELTANKRFA